MAATGLLALLDDIAALTKIAAKKTIGISGDDLAVNAHTLAGSTGGIDPKRELPMVYAVAKGSLRNKFFYLIPGALGLSLAAPWLITPLMMAGGAYLAYEGVEKMLHKNKHDDPTTAPVGPALLEQQKIKSAVKTDFILSAEIVVVALGALATAPFLTQLGVLSLIGVGMTAGIYGLVGGLVKLDDLGLKLAQRAGDRPADKFVRSFGRGLVKAVPTLMTGLSFLGTAAMFAVGGGILMHGVPMLEHLVTGAAHLVSASPLVVGMLETAATIGVGIVAGVAAIPAVKFLKEPVTTAIGIVKDLFTAHVQTPLQALARRLRGQETGAPRNDLPAAPAPNDGAAPALSALPDVKAALNAASPKEETGLPPEVKPVAPAFKAFESALERNFGK
ncbi:MAG TPA: DUF808 domain-containing protein [Patescibacteria group bacterium]|nr:DUF808 domain-containing protein [Patescibacteria group bacterium]